MIMLQLLKISIIAMMVIIILTMMMQLLMMMITMIVGRVSLDDAEGGVESGGRSRTEDAGPTQTVLIPSSSLIRSPGPGDECHTGCRGRGLWVRATAFRHRSLGFAPTTILETF